MFKVQGAYGEASINAGEVDEESMRQIYELLNTPLADKSNIVIMPDVHAGAGCVIGLTMTLTDKICANLLGVDIGCGVRVQKFRMKPELTLEKMDDLIREVVPLGFTIHANEKTSPLLILSLDKMKCREAVDVSRAMRSIGTLGGGEYGCHRAA